MGAVGILCIVGKCKENGEEFGKSKLDFIMFKKEK
jgi:hypothetical protein